MKELFNDEQLMVLKEIAKDKDLVERVKWWVDQIGESSFCPMTKSDQMASKNECNKLCFRIWYDLVICCPCHGHRPAKEAALIILEEAKNGNQD
ncbi:MAG: hypothetical protein ABFC98_03110 [Candidatus Cloacimonas sp.]